MGVVGWWGLVVGVGVRRGEVRCVGCVSMGGKKG